MSSREYALSQVAILPAVAVSGSASPPRRASQLAAEGFSPTAALSSSSRQAAHSYAMVYFGGSRSGGAAEMFS